MRARRTPTAILATILATILIAGFSVACVPPPPVVPISMDAGGHFFTMPWPSDTRLAPDGSLDLAGLPGVELLPDEEPGLGRDLLPGIVDEIASSLHGYGVNTAVYFHSQVGLDTSSFPTPSGSTAPRSTVMLMDLDRPGERAPVLVDQQLVGDRNRPDGLLGILPYPGHPLRESTRYAAVLFDGLEITSGQEAAPSELLSELDQPWSPSTGFDEQDWDLLRAQRDEVREVVGATTEWDAGDILAFTVYTTQDVDRDLHAVADAIHASPPPAVQFSYEGPCAPDVRAGGREVSQRVGTIELTRWQEGTYPYYGTGGRIVVGADGRAVPQDAFAAELSVAVPCGEPPPGGWPLVVFITGTGGGWDHTRTLIPYEYGGYVYAQISPVFGEGRGITITPEMTQFGVSSLFEAQRFTMYNFFNPEAVRANTIQQAAEFLELLEGVEHLTFDGAGSDATGPVTTDPSRQVVTGQSQGAQALPMVAAARPSLAGVIAAAGGGGLFHNVAHTRFNRTFFGLLTGDAEPLDELNPIVQLGQAMVEGGDGTNFPSTTNYLQYHGRNDCVPEYGRYAAGAIGLDLATWFPPEGTYGDPALEPRPATLPVQGNVDGATRVALERPGGHFVAFDQIVVNTAFLADLAAGVVPTVPAEGYVVGSNSTHTCTSDRWDDPPTMFGR